MRWKRICVPLLLLILWVSAGACVEPMKTSIFDMNFTLPPLVEMTEVEKEMPTFLSLFSCARHSCSAYNC